MNLNELKQHSVPDLIETLKSMGGDHSARMRRQDIIFSILKSQAKKGEDIFSEGFLKSYRTDSDFYAPPTVPTLPARMIFTYRQARFDVSICAPAIR